MQRNVESLSDLEIAQAVAQNYQMVMMAQDALMKLDGEINKRNTTRNQSAEAIKEQLESNAVPNPTTE
jgi:hypothetical protein